CDRCKEKNAYSSKSQASAALARALSFWHRPLARDTLVVIVSSMSIRFVASLLFTLTVLGCESLLAQTPTWKLLPGAPSGTTPRFDDISFVNERTGFVARATGGIYKTTDAGNTFTLSHSSTFPYPGTNLVAHFRSIMFISESQGFAGNLG